MEMGEFDMHLKRTQFEVNSLRAGALLRSSWHKISVLT